MREVIPMDNPCIQWLGRALFALGVLATLGQPFSARAASLVVTTTTDQADAAPGDGACRTAAGSCTLRAAIQEANARSGPDTITLPAGRYSISIDGDDDNAAAGDFDVADDLTIVGTGATATFLDGGGEQATAVDRVLHVLANATASISKLTVQFGNKSLGGGILNEGTLTVSDATVAQNEADVGGGIQNYGTLTIENSAIERNLAHFGGGGINNNERGTARIRASAFTNNAVDGVNLVFVAQGGGISNNGAMTIEDSQVVQNALAGDFSYGAGIDQTRGQLTLRNSRITSNISAAFGQAWGGGIAARGGTLIIGGSSIDGNAAADRRPNDPDPDGLGGGGGVYIQSATLDMADSHIFNNITTGEFSTASGAGILHDGGTTTVARTTISNNRSALDGGGILTISGTLALTNSTVSGNQTQRSGGGVLTRSQGTTRLTNVTIAANTAVQAGDGIANAGATQLLNTLITNGAGSKNCQLTSPLTSQGNNLENADTCALRGAADRVGQDPLLGPLTNNGGLTPTHALLAGSPAIDAGNSAGELCPATDQRGAPRPAGRGCDIGAYEAGGAAPLDPRFRVYLPLVRRS